jgi:hypothetical protein
MLLNDLRRLPLGLMILASASSLVACGSGGGDDKNDAPPALASSSRAASVASSLASSSVTSSVSVSQSSVASSSSAPAVVCNAGEEDAISLDFESVTPGMIPTGFNLTGSGIAVANDKGAKSGTHALLLDSSKGPSWMSPAQSGFTGCHWGRLFYKNLSKPNSITNWSHTTLVEAVGGSTQYRLVDMVAAPDYDSNKGNYQHLYNIDNSSRIDISLEGPYQHSYGNEWVCLEWQVNAEQQIYKVFFNSNELPLKNGGMVTNKTDLKQAKRWDNATFDFVPVPAEFDRLKIGIQNYQGHPYTFLIDDVSIGQARLGCRAAPEPVVLGKAEYEQLCQSCHRPEGDARTARYTSITALANYIGPNMPIGNPAACQGQCASDVASYIVNSLNSATQ